MSNEIKVSNLVSQWSGRVLEAADIIDDALILPKIDGDALSIVNDALVAIQFYSSAIKQALEDSASKGD